VEEPFVIVSGGAKVEDKIAVLENLGGRADAVLIGGKMAEDVRSDNPFSFHAVLPTDVVAAASADADASTMIVPAGEIPEDLMGLDIGPDSVAAFTEVVGSAKTVLWNGPMGVFELAPFAAGTLGVARACAEASAFTVVGGGDSLAAVSDAGLESSFDHLSTGGGASLEFLEGRALPGITILEDPTP